MSFLLYQYSSKVSQNTFFSLQVATRLSLTTASDYKSIENMSLHCSPSLLTNTTFQIRHLDISALFASGASCVMGSRPTERYVEKHVTTITKEAGIVIPGFFI